MRYECRGWKTNPTQPARPSLTHTHTHTHTNASTSAHTRTYSGQVPVSLHHQPAANKMLSLIQTLSP